MLLFLLRYLEYASVCMRIMYIKRLLQNDRQRSKKRDENCWDECFRVISFYVPVYGAVHLIQPRRVKGLEKCSKFFCSVYWATKEGIIGMETSTSR